MHISEGVLSPAVLVSGAALALAGTAVGLKQMDQEKIPKVAVLTSAFFIASLVHIPIGPANAHLILNGLMGILLGWSAFPAILIGLLLQAILFQYGGLTPLGVNTTIMSLPAVVCFYLFRNSIKSSRYGVATVSAFSCGFLAVLLGTLMSALALALTGKAFLLVSKVIIVAHLPVMVIEGIITAVCIQFLKKVKPEILEVLNNDD